MSWKEDPTALAWPSPPRNDPSPHWWHWPWWLLGWERGCPIIGSLRLIIIWSLSDYPQSTTSPMGRFQWREINFNDYGSQHTNPISNISQTRFDSGNCIFSFGLKPIVIFCWFTCASLKNLYEIPRRGGLVWKLSRGYAFLKFTIDSLFQIEFQSQAYSQQLFQLLWHILHLGQF